MKAQLVPDQLTRHTAEEVTLALFAGFREVLAKEPRKDSIAVLWAQWAIETGRGRSMHCNNPGNIKAVEDYEGFYCQFRCNEIIGGRVIWFDPPNAACNFRAFEQLPRGAADYVRFLATRPRYARAWQQVLAADPVAFVHALKLSGYFTAHEDGYRDAVVSLFHDEQATIEHVVFRPDPMPSWERPDPEHSTLTYEDLVARALELRTPIELADEDVARARAERDEQIEETDYGQ